MPFFEKIIHIIIETAYKTTFFLKIWVFAFFLLRVKDVKK